MGIRCNGFSVRLSSLRSRHSPSPQTPAPSAGPRSAESSFQRAESEDEEDGRLLDDLFS